MSELKRKPEKQKKKKKLSALRLILIIIVLLIFISIGTAFGVIFAIVKSVPPIDPSKVTAYLNENSVILDQNGELIEKVDAKEFRTIVELDEISDYMKNAIIAIEDERFYTHYGIDPKGMVRAFVYDLKEMSFEQGASTITQQLARNIYLTKEKKVTRKIKEMYIAIQLDRELTKEQILKSYLNTVFFGQRAYGVQAAAQAYFSKDAKDLTLAESAMIAGAPKSSTLYSLYFTVDPNKYDKDKHLVVGTEDPHQVQYIDVAGKLYVPVFNPKAVERQRIILKKMLDLEMINQTEYDEAIKVDMRQAIHPDPKRNENIETSYLNDYLKDCVINDLMDKFGYTREEAREELFTGGLKVYSTMDIKIQSQMEAIYNNFGEILTKNSGNIVGAKLVKRTLDSQKNIIDSFKNIAYYTKDNLLDQDYNLIIEKGTYEILSDGNIAIKNKKLNYRNADITDYYTIDEDKNLLTHSVWSLDPKTCYTSDRDNKRLLINKSFLDTQPNFYSIDNNGNMLINSKYFYKDKKGIVQPQSAFVLMDYNGHIKALVGGRNIKGSRVLNRATTPRQPGSALKPVSVYLPALDNGFTAASIVDDVPHYDNKGNLWPRNWYGRRNSYEINSLTDDYRGLVTLRESVEQSINVASVKFLEKLGLETSIEYLTRMGIIDSENPSNDSFTTKEEAIAKGSSNFDENYSALALGGMTKGISPLKMTAAYGAIANKGIYTEPIAYTKVLDRDGNIILESKSKQNTVASSQVAYLMTDILKSTVTKGIAKSARLYSYNAKIPAAGKTGTTQNKVDAWFVGFTPYYIAGTWIGNDNQSIKLDNGSKYAAVLWSNVMKEIHKDLAPKDFTQEQGFVTKIIDTESGKLATELSKRDPRGSTAVSEIFIKGTEPIEYDDVHVEVPIDISTGKLANEYCPPELIENKVFIQRPETYIPEENLNYLPRDYQYQVPTEYCDVHAEPDSLWDRLFDNNDSTNENTQPNINPNQDTNTTGNTEYNNNENENTSTNNNKDVDDMFNVIDSLLEDD